MKEMVHYWVVLTLFAGVIGCATPTEKQAETSSKASKVDPMAKEEVTKREWESLDVRTLIELTNRIYQQSKSIYSLIESYSQKEREDEELKERLFHQYVKMLEELGRVYKAYDKNKTEENRKAWEFAQQESHELNKQLYEMISGKINRKIDHISDFAQLLMALCESYESFGGMAEKFRESIPNEACATFDYLVENSIKYSQTIIQGLPMSDFQNNEGKDAIGEIEKIANSFQKLKPEKNTFDEQIKELIIILKNLSVSLISLKQFMEARITEMRDYYTIKFIREGVAAPLEFKNGDSSPEQLREFFSLQFENNNNLED